MVIGNPIQAMRQRCQSGYTLVEILVALAIIGVLLGTAIPVIDSIRESSRLQEPAQKLYGLLHESRSTSFNENRTLVLRLHEKGFALYQPGQEQPLQHYDLPEDTRYLFKPWLARNWLTPQGYEWIITPFDLAEPLSFRFERGEQYLEQTYHPLTAEIIDESLFIP